MYFLYSILSVLLVQPLPTKHADMLKYLFWAMVLVVAVFRPEKAKAQYLSWRNYTSNDGLPGNEVYDMLQDSRGLLWFVTDQGICHFNGYEFIQPVDTSSQRGSEAFLPTEDVLGRIWFTRLDGTVWFVENDTIRAWKYNNLAAPFWERHLIIENIGIDADETVWLAMYGLGFLCVGEDGARQVKPAEMRKRFVFTSVGKRLLYTTQFDETEPGKPADQSHLPITYLKKGISESLDSRLTFDSKHHSDRGIWKMNNGDLIIASQGKLALVRNGRMVWHRRNDIGVHKITESPRGDILVASHFDKNNGLYHFPSVDHLRRNESRNLLPDCFVTAVYCDPTGGWWATTHNSGVYYCKNPGLHIFDSTNGLPSDEVICLTNDGKSTIFAGLLPVNIASLDVGNTQILVLPKPTLLSRGVQAIYFDKHRQRLWCSEMLCYLQNNQWKPAQQNADLKFGAVLAKSIKPDPNNKDLWTSSSFNFFKVDAHSGVAERMGTSKQKNSKFRTFSVTPDLERNVWVTTTTGLWLWEYDTFTPPPFQHQALRYQPRDVVILPGGGMAIGLRGRGVLIRDWQGTFTHLTRHDGLSDDVITKLVIGTDTAIYACTNAGLNRLTTDAEGRWHIYVIDAKQGLPSNEVHDVTFLAGETWIATNKGLVRYRQQLAPFNMPAPVLEKLTVNNRIRKFTPALRLAYDENNLTLRFYALFFRADGDIAYRYRMLGSDTAFVYTRTREVSFARLSPGSYVFEVQAQNEVGWGEPTRWSFEVQAAWWQTRWFAMSLFLLLTAGLYLWYRSRLDKSRREAEVYVKIRDLESAALRAQINPHFIFNCLGSIQHFIAQNDAESAISYLSRFARLVRLALHGSVEGQHSLREEMEMLENYLALEQMRFRGKFQYEIKADPSLDPTEVRLPPMLIQPFVENALLHGMKNKTDGGRITVEFSSSENELVVLVTDNGQGVDASTRNAETSGYKSVGIMLTQRRLEVLAGQNSDRQAFSTETVSSTDKSAVGTRVVLRIPMS